MCRLVELAVLSLALSLPVSSRGETEAGLRTELQKLVKTYVDAMNSGDVNAMMDMYSRKPIVASAGNGQVQRGWDAIRHDSEQIVGKEGSFKMSLGVVDVVPLGTTHALAFTSGTLTAAVQVRKNVKLAQAPIAFTFVLERAVDGWKILHQHASMKQ